LLADRQQGALAVAKEAVYEVAQVAHRAGEAIELDHEERVGLAGAQHRQRAIERRPRQGLRRLARVDLDRHQVEIE
jgi:hypothetical protein